jgi:hypothetical protein
MRSNIAWFFCLFLFASPLNVLRAADVSLKIDVVAWGNEIKGLSFKPGSSKGGITALGFRYSTPVAYSGPVIMEIYQSGGGTATPARELSAQDKAHELHPLVVEEKTEANNKTATKQGLALELEKRRQKEPTLVALAALPGSACRRATVLLGPADGGTFTAYVIDDDPGKLPLGQVRIHNLCPLTIAMRCNGKPAQELKTRETLIVPPKNQQLFYDLAYKLGDEWIPQENNSFSIRPKEQTQMIILKSSNQFFLSSDGSSGGFLQTVILRRIPTP